MKQIENQRMARRERLRGDRNEAGGYTVRGMTGGMFGLLIMSVGLDDTAWSRCLLHSVDLARNGGFATVLNDTTTQHPIGAVTMASKKKLQEQQKKKMRLLKKKKLAQAKILEARNADPAEKKSGDRGSNRPEFGGKSTGGQHNSPTAPPMHRPQGG